MEIQEVMEWLDRLLANLEEQKELMELNSSIRTITPCKYIQLYKGINLIADTLGVELKHERSYEYHVYSFVYKGVMIVQYEEEEL